MKYTLAMVRNLHIAQNVHISIKNVLKFFRAFENRREKDLSRYRQFCGLAPQHIPVKLCSTYICATEIHELQWNRLLSIKSDSGRKQ